MWELSQVILLQLHADACGQAQSMSRNIKAQMIPEAIYKYIRIALAIFQRANENQ